MDKQVNDFLQHPALQLWMERKKLVEENDYVTWLPVLYLNEEIICIGLAIDGHWVLESKNGLVRLNEPASFSRAISLLEKPLSQIMTKVGNNLDNAEASSLSKQIFPWVEITKAGLEQGSLYWAELAFEWFRELNIADKQHLAKSLEIVSRAKWASQKLRQKAGHELANLAKYNSREDT